MEIPGVGGNNVKPSGMENLGGVGAQTEKTLRGGGGGGYGYFLEPPILKSLSNMQELFFMS